MGQQNTMTASNSASHPLEDPMTTRACPRRVTTAAYYLGRPAVYWLAALAQASTTRESPRESCAGQ